MSKFSSEIALVVGAYLFFIALFVGCGKLIERAYQREVKRIFDDLRQRRQ